MGAPARDPLYIRNVTSPVAWSVNPLKEGVRLLLTLPLGGFVIVTLGAAALAVPTAPTAVAHSDTAAACKSARPALLMSARSEPSHAPERGLRRDLPNNKRSPP
jgi:hypothetical protein